ncbi:MAG: hypothetical protein ACYDCQ_00200 [Dehalococcoidia bacterium]
MMFDELLEYGEVTIANALPRGRIRNTLRQWTAIGTGEPPSDGRQTDQSVHRRIPAGNTPLIRQTSCMRPYGRGPCISDAFIRGNVFGTLLYVAPLQADGALLGLLLGTQISTLP